MCAAEGFDLVAYVPIAGVDFVALDTSIPIQLTKIRTLYIFHENVCESVTNSRVCACYNGNGHVEIMVSTLISVVIYGIRIEDYIFGRW